MNAVILRTIYFCFLVLNMQSIQGDSHARQRRSIIDLSQMIAKVTNRNPKEFLLYGNWCGPGGGGPAVDHIDACCQIHDNCYAKLEQTSVCTVRSSISVYLVSYQWSFKGGQILCGATNTECQQALCDCDRFVANCFAKHIPFYNRQQHRLRKILAKD